MATGAPRRSSPGSGRSASSRRWCSTGLLWGAGSPQPPHGTGTAFRAYVEQFLAPALEPDDVVVLDNLAAHKVDGVRQAIAAAGASILYLPPYSPDLNPIERLFAKLKTLLRKAAARTKEQLWSTIGRLLEAYTPAECTNLPQPLRLWFNLTSNWSRKDF